MRKFKLSVIEKKLIRSIIIILVIQLLIIQVFVNSYKNSFPVDVQETEYVDITVSDVIKLRGRHSDLALNVYTYLDNSDYTKFVFYQSNSANEYSVGELNDVIFPGDHLSLRYVERRSIFGQKNVVVDAKTETEIYRTLDEYNKGGKESRITMIVLFSIIELIFLIGSVLHICFEFKIIKGLIRKIKKYFQKRFADNRKKA